MEERNPKTHIEDNLYIYMHVVKHSASTLLQE